MSVFGGAERLKGLMVVVVVLDIVAVTAAVAARKEGMKDFILTMLAKLWNLDCIYTLAQ